MDKVLFTTTDLIRRVLGINIGRCYNQLQAFISRGGVLLGMRTGRFAFKYVDAGGHRLRMLISGCGRPSVVFKAGGYPASGNSLEAWKRVQPEVSKFASTVAYDRAGIGLSASGPEPRDARQIARELHRALENAGVLPPYILTGSSFGGPLIRVFAGLFPAEVCGMVHGRSGAGSLLPVDPESVIRMPARSIGETSRQASPGAREPGAGGHSGRSHHCHRASRPSHLPDRQTKGVV